MEFCHDRKLKSKKINENFLSFIVPLLFAFQTPKEYEKEYQKELRQKGVEASKFHGFAYDGIWVIAKTLTRVMDHLRIRKRQNAHNSSTVKDEDVVQMVLSVMNETNFNGVTVSQESIFFFFKWCLA